MGRVTNSLNSIKTNSLNVSGSSGDSNNTVTTTKSVISNKDIPSGHILFNFRPYIGKEVDRFIQILRELAINNEDRMAMITEAEARYKTSTI